MPKTHPDTLTKTPGQHERSGDWRGAGALGARATLDMPAPVPRNARLDYLERRTFDSTRAHVALELYNHNVFITPLDAFDMPGDARLHPIPEEFSMFIKRRQRIDDMLYAGDKLTTRKKDQQERAAGIDVDGRMFGMLQQFLAENPRGTQIMHDMGLYETPIDQLTPKESIYLIGYLIHELTNFDVTQSDRGDERSPYEIIANGMGAESKEDVQPLGICRNFADTGEALFLALKSRNPQLTNVYCNNIGGFQGAMDGQFYREGEAMRGHAWLDFACVDGAGNMAITTVDPTWAKREGRRLEKYDLTAARINVSLRNLAAGERHNYSDRKLRNLERVTGYYVKRIDKMVDMLKKRYPTPDDRLHLRDIPQDDRLFLATMHVAVDYIISGQEFGGSVFSPVESTDPTVRKMVILAYESAQRTDLILSNSEYRAVQSILGQLWRKYPGSRDAITGYEEALKARHKAHMLDPNNASLFEMNEGDLAKPIE